MAVIDDAVASLLLTAARYEATQRELWFQMVADLEALPVASTMKLRQLFETFLERA